MPTHTQSLLSAVTRTRSALRTRTLLHASITGARDLLLCALILGVTGALFPLPSVARVLSGLFACACAAVLAMRVIRPLRQLPTVPGTAACIDATFPQLRGSVAPAVDLALHGARSPGASQELTAAAIDAVNEQVAPLDTRAVARARITRLPARSAALAAAGVLIAAAISPGGVGRALVALARPGVVRDARIDIAVRPGDIIVRSGETVNIAASIQEDATERTRVSAAPLVWTRTAGGEWGSVPMTRARVAHGVSGDWTARIANVERDVAYRVGVGEHGSPEYTIRVLADPALVSAHVAYQPPTYTGQPGQSLDQPTGELAGLEGTVADVTYHLNAPVRAARLVWEDGAHAPIPLAVRDGGRALNVRLPLRWSGRYAIAVTAQGAAQRVSGTFAVATTQDAPPIVHLLQPPDETTIPRDMQVSVEMDARDDFGLRSVALIAWKDGSDDRTRTNIASPGGEREFHATVGWDLRRYGLTPGSTLLYYVEASDNNAVRGSQSARSEVRRLVFPTLADIYAEASQEHKESADDLSELLERGEDIKKDLDDAARDARSSKSMSWEDKQSLQQALEQQQKIADNIENVTKQLDETLDKLRQESVVNEDLLRKVAEIQNLVKNLGNEELRKAIQRLSDALRNVNQADLKNAMAQVQMTQEEMMKRLDRTIALLQKIQREEKLEALARQAEELSEQQKQLNDGLQKKQDAAERREAADRQEQAAKQADQAQKDTRQLAKDMQKDEPQAAQELQQAAEQMEEQQPQTAMQRAAQMMRQGDQQGAQKQGQKAQQDMQQMAQSLRNAQKKMQDQQRRELAEAMENVARDMLQLSNKQEAVSQQSSGESTNDLAQRQDATREETENVANRLFELGRKTPFITQDLAQAVGKALQNAQESTDAFERGNRSMGEQRARSSSSALNQAVTQLLEAKESACSGSQGGGQSTAQAMMQRLQSLSQMQGQVNAESEQLMQGMSGQPRPTPSAQGQLARLAAQQEMIQKGLADLAKKAGQANDQIRKLDRVADDMKSVTQDMQSSKLTPDVLDRQHKIHSRLLDAQHAVDKRDFEKTRTSESGVEVTVQSPGPVPSSALGTRDRLTIDLLRAKSDPVPPEYRRAIDAYFRALTNGGGNR